VGKESNFKEIFKFAGTYLSVCIGSGFATGQEIMQFFSAHGMISILSSIICMVIMSYCGASLLEIGKTQKLKSSNEIFTYLCGDLIGRFFKILMPVFFLFTFIVMISGAGASINQYYGVDKNIGSLILIILVLVSVLMGINKVIDILGNIGPMIAIVAIGVGLITICRNFETFMVADEIINNLNVTKAVDSWWLTGIVYCGLNLIMATPFLVGVGATAKNRSNCIKGGILGSLVFMLAAMSLNLGIISDIQNTYIREIPTLYMADKIGPMVGMMFSVMLIAGIYTTAVPLLWSVCNSFAEEKSEKFIIIAVVCSIISLIGGRLPFSMLVNLIYPLSGIFGIIIICSLFIKKLKKNKYVVLQKGYRQ